MNTKNKAILKFSLFVVILILAIIIFWKPLTNIFSDKENVKEFVLGFGIFAPIIFILVIALQVLLAPIPGQVAGLAGGFIFGAALGTNLQTKLSACRNELASREESKLVSL